MLKGIGAGFASVAMLAQAVPANPTIEVVKVSLLAIITAAVLWTARTVFVNRDDVQKIKQWLFGVGGKGGADSDIEQLQSAMRDVLLWKQTGEIIKNYDKENYNGPDRRHQSRRLGDQLLDAHRHSDEHPTHHG